MQLSSWRSPSGKAFVVVVNVAVSEKLIIEITKLLLVYLGDPELQGHQGSQVPKKPAGVPRFKESLRTGCLGGWGREWGCSSRTRFARVHRKELNSVAMPPKDSRCHPSQKTNQTSASCSPAIKKSPGQDKAAQIQGASPRKVLKRNSIL